MAKPRKKKTPKVGGLPFEQDKAKNFIDRVESLLGNLDSERGEYMAVCKGFREDIKSVYEEAKAAGIDPRAMKGVIEARILERRAEKVRDDLPTDSQNTFDQIRFAIGDLSGTPLGDFAEGQADDVPRTTEQDTAALDALSKIGQGNPKDGAPAH